MTIVLQQLVLGVLIGGLYGLAAAGLSLIFGVMKVLNVAHGELIMLGGYGAFWLFALGGVDPFAALVVVIPVALAGGALLYWGLFGWVVRYHEETRIKNSLLIGFGLGLALHAAAVQLWTADERSITTAYAGSVLDVGGVSLPVVRLASLVIAFVLIGGLHLLLNHWRWGRAIRATADDWEAALMTGIDVRRAYLIAFAIRTALAGAAGPVGGGPRHRRRLGRGPARGAPRGHPELPLPRAPVDRAGAVLERHRRLRRPGQPRSRGLLRAGRAGHPRAVDRGHARRDRDDRRRPRGRRIRAADRLGGLPAARRLLRHRHARAERDLPDHRGEHARRDLDAAPDDDRHLSPGESLLVGAGPGRAGDRGGGRARAIAPGSRHAGHSRGRGRRRRHRRRCAPAEADRPGLLDRARRPRWRLLRVLPHLVLSLAPVQPGLDVRRRPDDLHRRRRHVARAGAGRDLLRLLQGVPGHPLGGLPPADLRRALRRDRAPAAGRAGRGDGEAARTPRVRCVHPR